jgi:phage FluMu protein Com
MTIRYTCTECESVLKIKDEKAGTKGKCPKCRTEFLVPYPEEEDDGIEVESSPEAAPADLIDMPIELTPEVSESEDFDPLAVLGGPGPSGPPPRRATMSASGGAGSDRRPSVAELMKDFEATKKKDKEKKSTPEMTRPSAVSSAAETSGSAADALSRAYQQKRDSASAPSVSAKEAKAIEQRELLMDFIKTRAIPGILLIGGILYGYFWWLNSEVYNGPPLFDVTGQVLRNGKGVGGVQISFEPLVSGPTDPRSMAYGTSDKDGNFTLQYSASLAGAPAGDYRIGMMGNDGIPIPYPNGELRLTVTENGPNEFKIDL